METAQREMSFLLAEPERRLLRWIAARLPGYWTPDLLTVLGILIEQALTANVEQICVVVRPGNQPAYAEATGDYARSLVFVEQPAAGAKVPEKGAEKKAAAPAEKKK